jgi:hypothetical protein
MNQDRSSGEAVFEVPECLVNGRGPRELNLGRGECRQGGGGEILVHYHLRHMTHYSTETREGQRL